MPRGLRFVLVIAAVAQWAGGPAGTARAQSLYTVKDLGSFGGTWSGAEALIPGPIVVGYSFLPGNSAMRAFIDDGGGPQDLGTLGGPQAQARHLNTHGDVVGWANTAAGEKHAFRWHGGVMSDLGTLGGSVSDAFWIADDGDVVGSSYAPGDTVERAVLWHAGTMTDLGTLGGTDARAYCMNDLGDIVGFARISSNNELHAVRWSRGTLTDLGTLGGWASHAYAVNDAGKVCGWSMKVPNYVSHAFIWSEGVTVDLGTLGGVYSAAYALNGDGQAVGASTDAGEVQRAFLWDGTKMLDLNTLGPAQAGWLITAAYDIDDSGVIVGVGVRGGVSSAVMLTPSGALGAPVAGDRLDFSGPTPNPARGAAALSFSLTRAGTARVQLYDAAGRRVSTLADGEYGPGTTRLAWDGRDAAGAAATPGMYFARFEGEGRVLTRRFVFLR